MIVVPWGLTFRHGIGLIALAAVALGLSRHLQDPQSEAPEPGDGSSAGAIATDG